MKNYFFRGFNKEINCFITEDGKEVKFDRKNVLHVMYIKMFILMDAVVTLNSGISSIENGATISDISTDIVDGIGKETYWLDCYTSYEDVAEINPFDSKIGQLCLQVDADGNWY